MLVVIGKGIPVEVGFAAFEIYAGVSHHQVRRFGNAIQEVIIEVN
jgi:hypothetical protein